MTDTTTTTDIIDNCHTFAGGLNPNAPEKREVLMADLRRHEFLPGADLEGADRFTADDFSVGDVVAIFSRGRVRQAIVMKVGRTNLRAEYTTPGALKESADCHARGLAINPEQWGKRAAEQAADTFDFYQGMADGTYPWKWEYDRAEYVARRDALGDRDSYIEAQRVESVERATAARDQARRVGPTGYLVVTGKSVKFEDVAGVKFTQAERDRAAEMVTQAAPLDAIEVSESPMYDGTEGQAIEPRLAGEMLTVDGQTWRVTVARGPQSVECIEKAITLARVTGSTGASHTEETVTWSQPEGGQPVRQTIESIGTVERQASHLVDAAQFERDAQAATV